eukprot:gene2974-1932_t
MCGDAAAQTSRPYTTRCVAKHRLSAARMPMSASVAKPMPPVPPMMPTVGMAAAGRDPSLAEKGRTR